MTALAPMSGPLIARVRLWSTRTGLGRKLAFCLAAAAVASGVATVAAMTEVWSAGPPDPRTVLIFLSLDVLLLLMLGVVVAWRLAAVWAERRRGLAGSGLHVRLVMLFSLATVTPAILVAVFSGVFLNLGIESWFDQRVRTALDQSQKVAQAYLHEHRQSIRADAFAMANDLNRDALTLMGDGRRFSQVLSAQAALRSLPEALVVDSGGRVLARSELSLSLEFELAPPEAMELADRGEIVVLTPGQEDRVRAVIRLDRFVDAYLLVGRFVDPRVLNYVENVEKATSQYKRLEKRLDDIQIIFAIIFVLVVVLLLLAAVWVGMAQATQLARPISNLISAAERVRKGDLGVRVEDSTRADELGTLSRAFNRMTGQLESQQTGLMEANRQLDERRRFMETVLAGVSAGVIGLDIDGRINLTNRSASELLAIDLEKSVGKTLGEAVPEMADLLKGVMERPDRMQQTEIKLVREGRFHTFVARMAAERLGGDIIGYVVTFDDVTELISAQRTAAWADVARRIAHEIKNPLTPIQLSAERLKRKYLKEIKSDPETFSVCTDTIVRQVEDMGRMVDEFSSFARMPQPTMKPDNLSKICQQAVFLERNRHPEIEFTVEVPDEGVHLRCDSRQVAQALTNLMKNAAESITDRQAADGETLPRGHIRFMLQKETADDGVRIIIAIEDNGKGLPEEHRDRLTEPYVTARTKGTGLGLAIVKKIMEDHNGDLVLEDRQGGGARISLIFHPVGDTAGAEEGGEDESPAGKDADPMKVATDILAHGS